MRLSPSCHENLGKPSQEYTHPVLSSFESHLLMYSVLKPLIMSSSLLLYPLFRNSSRIPQGLDSLHSPHYQCFACWGWFNNVFLKRTTWPDDYDLILMCSLIMLRYLEMRHIMVPQHSNIRTQRTSNLNARERSPWLRSCKLKAVQLHRIPYYVILFIRKYFYLSACFAWLLACWFFGLYSVWRFLQSCSDENLLACQVIHGCSFSTRPENSAVKFWHWK